MLNPRVTIGDVPADEACGSAVDILSESEIFSIATVDGMAVPNANVAFFAFDDALNLYFVSDRSTRHSANLAHNHQVAAAVYLAPPNYGENLRGVQVRGVAKEVPETDTAHPLETYRRRFPDFAQDEAVRDNFLRAVGPSVLYQLSVAELTVLDEPRFGRRNYITVSIGR